MNYYSHYSYMILPVGVGVTVLIVEVLTRLSKFTRAEFSPRKDCGVFFIAPVLCGKDSPIPLKSNGSEDNVATEIYHIHYKKEKVIYNVNYIIV